MLYTIEGALSVGSTPLLERVSVQWPDQSVVAIVGPSGGGKSSLLTALAPGDCSPVQRHGEWFLKGVPIDRSREGVVLTRQPARGETMQWSLPVVGSGARHAIWLLDEPVVPDVELDRAVLVRHIRDQAQRGAVILVTHDVSFARRVADVVCLICAKRIEASLPTPEFFGAPPSEMVARFIAQGNCWPKEPSIPKLPSHFHWLLPEQLAGMGRPGLLGDEQEDFASLAAVGVTLLVTLTERALQPDLLRAAGIVGRHCAIPDMAAPPVHVAARLCRDIEREIAHGGRVVVHCHAGLGRTGTMLAAYLVWTGTPAEEAIARVRATIRGAIQTREQAMFVERFASDVG